MTAPHPMQSNGTPISAVPARIVVSCFDHSRDTAPKAISCPWPEFVAQIAHHEFRAQKDGRLYSPAEFLPGTTRLDKNVVRVHFGTLDLDDWTPEQVASLGPLLQGYAYAMYTTWRHAEAYPKGLWRLRLVLPLSRPVPHADWRAFYVRMAARFGGSHDTTCLNESRMFYFPSLPLGAEALANFRQQDGAPLDVDAILRDPLPVTTPLAPKPVPLPSSPFDGVGTARHRGAGYGGAALADAAEKISHAANGQRNNTLNREALGIAQLVAGGVLDHATAWSALTDAARVAGLDERETQATLTSAFGKGMQQPRGVPAPVPSVVNGVSVGNVNVGTRATDPAQKPTIRIAVDLDRMVNEGAAALATDPTLYQRAGELVTITVQPEKATYERDERRGNEMAMRPGTPLVRALDLASLRVTLARIANWVKWKAPTKKDEEGTWSPARPDPDTVAALISPAACENWPNVRPIRGILETPFLAPSGRVVSQDGYDPETGFVLRSSIDVASIIPDRPTQEQARAALRYLWTELFIDFPFRGLGESKNSRDDSAAKERFDRACSCPDAFVAIGQMLTVIARGAIQGAVMSASFEAPSQGSGKTKQMHLVSLVTCGRPAGTAAFPMSRDGKPNDEEVAKVLGAYARAGVPLVCFDNVKGEIGGGALEGAMTAEDSAPFRMLGTNEIVRLPWNAAILFSGNNMVMSEDVAQRMLVSRIESEREDPRSRSAEDFRHPDLFAWVRENRPHLVGACLVILRALMVAEKRPNCGTVGSFEAWSRMVPPAIVYAGGPSIIEARPKDGAVDSGEGAAHATLMREWPACFANGVKAGSLIKHAFPAESNVYDFASKTALAPPDGMDDFRAAIRELMHIPEKWTPDPGKFGYVLRALRGKWRDGMKLCGDKGDRNGIVTWRVERRDVPREAPAPLAMTDDAAMLAAFEGIAEARHDPADDFDRAL